MMDANGALDHEPPLHVGLLHHRGGCRCGGQRSHVGRNRRIDGCVHVGLGTPSLGHRRSLISNLLHTVGIGSTLNIGAIYVAESFPSAGLPWIAWPPSGPVPIDLITTAVSLDQTGWSLQSDTIDVHAATVTVVMDGTDTLPVTTVALPGGYGSEYGIAWTPNGWTTQAGHTYTVTLTGISPTITYEVQPVTCP